MPFPVARSRDEALFYLDLNPCGCGSADTAWQSGLVTVADELVSRYAGRCRGCGADREFFFGLPERETTSARFPAFGGPEPSGLLDAGEWLWASDRIAGNVPSDDPHEAAIALAIATAAVEEVVKFVPPGQEEVPGEAFWTERGRRMRDAGPGRFRLDRLLVVRDAYRSMAAQKTT
ncbi:hypothetical protein [Streptosporangium pseudovulgare]|uniref:Uncharacterized protein n=1 Tax=Streptosporangium pseudovulgare TaxID=35765 RepID=A0ABQ2QX59_9ACTN|nr:hypothetical protein [Streptosporangium pseudovulgare]GGP98307.1 hypothetical protein GCM10010140_30640 [Streptosporangium pseudovulgare]